MTRILFFIAVAGSAMPVWADRLPVGHDCSKEWIQACVGSDQDKYRDWKPPTMYSAAQMQEIMENGSHICEYSKTGDCAEVRHGYRDEAYE
jgi:hypothetical protein